MRCQQAPSILFVYIFADFKLQSCLYENLQGVISLSIINACRFDQQTIKIKIIFNLRNCITYNSYT